MLVDRGNPVTDFDVTPLSDNATFLSESSWPVITLPTTVLTTSLSHSVSLTNVTSSWGPKRDPLYIVVPITVLYVMILLTGLVGNVSTCVVIARNKHMHTATNYYLFSLAISDLLLLVSGLPQEMYFIWWRVYPDVLGEKVCILQGFAAETSANATVLTITAFTVERYVAICHPFQSHTFSKLSRAVRLVMVIWLLALGLAVPQAIQFGVLERKAEDGTDVVFCTVTSELVQHAFEISTMVFFVAPMTLITVLYALIGLKLRRSRLLHAAKRASIGSSSTDRGNDRTVGGKSGSPQNYVIRMLVAVVVAFFICWAPFHAQRLLAMYARSNNSDSPVLLTVYKTLTYTSGVLYYMSTTVNPVLYHIMSHKFREAFKSTLADPCGCNRKNANKRLVYSALLCRQNNRHMSLQQQQHQRQQQTNQQQRHRSNSDDLQIPLRTQLLPNMGQHSSSLNQERQQARQHFRRHNSGDCEDQRVTPIELKLHGKPAESSVMSNSCPIYVHRPRESSNSSQTTITTSMGKLSLNEGNNNCRSETALVASDETTARVGAETNNGNCRKQFKPDLLVINDRKFKTCDAASKDVGDKNNVTCQGKLKQNFEGNCVGQRSGSSIAAVTRRLKSAPRTAAIGVLAKTLRSLPLPGNAKSIFTSQHKVEQSEGIHETAINRLSSHVSIESTISDSSLQDLDETEFVGLELARYMGELNQQRLVR